MSADDGIDRKRLITRPLVSPGPLAELKDELYGLYLSAGAPSTSRIHRRIHELAEGDEISDPTATPSLDTVHKVLSSPGFPANVHHVIAVTAALLFPSPVTGVVPVVRGNPRIEEIRRLWERAAKYSPPGRLITDTPAGNLEVRQTLPPGAHDTALLPAYVLRAHDHRLHDLAEAALDEDDPRSGIAILVSDSTSGKTRALFEVLHHPVLPPMAGARGRRRPRSLAEAGWQVWPPRNPMPAELFLRELELIGPRTVIWLNEAQRYLIEPDEHTARGIAAGLRAVLADPTRTPVLILGTLWPGYLDQLTQRAEPGQDRYADARALVTGHTARVPDTFAGADLAAARASTDSRIQDALVTADAASGTSGSIERVTLTQHMAGVPALLDLYNNASDTVTAVLHAAMDARRCGHPEWLPVALLHYAAPAYLDDQQQQHHLTDPDWFTRALETLLTPRDAANARALHRPPVLPGQPHRDDVVRLEDYLDQTGRTERAGEFPPGGFWDAIADTITEPEVLCQLAATARACGRLRRAFQLFQSAADQGSTVALLALAARRESVGDSSSAERLAATAACHGDTRPLRELAQMRERAGDAAGAVRLYQQAADNGDNRALLELGRHYEKAGDLAGAVRLYQQAADNGDNRALLELGRHYEKAGDVAGAERLYQQAADNGDNFGLRGVVRLRERAGDYRGVEQLWREAADRGNEFALRELSELREQAGDREGAEQLALEAVDRGDLFALQFLAVRRYDAGDPEDAERLAAMAADRGNTSGFVVLAERRRTHDPSGAERLYQLAADRGRTDVFADLAELRDEAGEADAAEQIAMMAADRGNMLALRVLGLRRQDAGDLIGAQRFHQMGADRGDYLELRELAGLREEAGDAEGAARLYQMEADHGDMYGLTLLADMWERTGQSYRARRLRLYGFADNGGIAESWE
jgi:hypothetical protein